jgi:hypothetical protein
MVELLMIAPQSPEIAWHTCGERAHTCLLLDAVVVWLVAPRVKIFYRFRHREILELDFMAELERCSSGGTLPTCSCLYQLKTARERSVSMGEQY